MLAERFPSSKHPARLLRAYLMEIRPLHWLKNGFVLAPLLFSRSFHDDYAVRSSLWALAAFCLAASTTYVWNDLWDATHDRRHEWKQYRPIASGEIPVRGAHFLIALLFGLTILVTALRVPAIGWQIVAYVGLNVAYSVRLKQVPWLDIAILSAGFVLRVDAGAAAIDVTPSAWMTITTLALSVYLASLKRYAELASHGSTARKSLEHYRADQLRLVAIVAGIASIGCYALFTMLVRHALLVSLLPVIGGVTRYGWLVLHRSGVDSPFLLIARDPFLIGASMLWGLAIVIGLW